MSCSTKQAPPGPWNGFTPATAELALAAAGAAAAGAAGGPTPCAKLTEPTEANTEFAAAAVSPALVRPFTNLRREMSCDRYFTTRSLIVVPWRLNNCGAHAPLR